MYSLLISSSTHSMVIFLVPAYTMRNIYPVARRIVKVGPDPKEVDQWPEALRESLSELYGREMEICHFKRTCLKPVLETLPESYLG